MTGSGVSAARVCALDKLRSLLLDPDPATRCRAVVAIARIDDQAGPAAVACAAELLVDPAVDTNVCDSLLNGIASTCLAREESLIPAIKIAGQRPWLPAAARNAIHAIEQNRAASVR